MSFKAAGFTVQQLENSRSFVPRSWILPTWPALETYCTDESVPPGTEWSGSRGVEDLACSPADQSPGWPRFLLLLNDVSSLLPFYSRGRDQREIMFGCVSGEQSRFLWTASSRGR